MQPPASLSCSWVHSALHCGDESSSPSDWNSRLLATLIDPSPLYKLYFVDPGRERKLSKKGFPRTYFRKWLESAAEMNSDNISQDSILSYLSLQIWRSSSEFWKWKVFVLSSFLLDMVSFPGFVGVKSFKIHPKFPLCLDFAVDPSPI